MLLRLISILLLSFLIFACVEKQIAENKTLPEIPRKPLKNIRGETCSVSENDIFKINNQNSVNACEVRKSAELFNGKIIRIESNYGFMLHGSFLRDTENCNGLSNSMEESISIKFHSETDFDQLHKREKPLIEISAVGKFSVLTPSKNSDTIYANTPYHFEVICLEKADF